METARKDVGVFSAYVFEFPLAPMHKSWLRAITQYDRVLLIAPRGHAKSSLASIAVPCFLIGQNRNIRLKIISCSDDRAKDIAFAIFRIVRNNDRYKEVFPDIRLDSKRVSKQKIYIVRDRKYEALKDATVESIGVTSAAEGSRADALIMDDVVSKRNSATPGLRNLVKEMYYNVHVNLLEPGKSKIIYIGTVWDRDDLTVELMQKENSYHKEIYAIDDDFTPLWPQVWTRDRLLERCKEIGLRRFNIGFRNQPSSDQELMFHDRMFDQCTDNSLQLNDLREIALKNIKEGRWKVSIGIDLASGELKKAKFHQRRRRAYNAIFTLAVDENDRRIPISIRRFRARSPETARLILQDYKQFKPEVILIENNAQSALIDWLGELTRMPIQTYFTDTIKHDDEKGVRSLATEFENRMWRLPAWSHEVDCSCEFCAWRREMLSYPFGRFTDTVMSCWLSREGVRLHMDSGAGVGKFALWET